MRVVETSDFAESAFLKAIQGSLAETRFNTERGRVVFVWSDPEGEMERALQKHRVSGVPVNSQAFADAFYWTKNRVFEYRRNEPNQSRATR